MNTIKMTLDYPEDILLALNETSEEFSKRLKILGAVKLYELSKLSLGKASELAGMDKISFIAELDKCKVPVIKYPLESLKQEIDTLKDLIDEE
ncbi:MAG: UPF0175 family protein [Candidatus Brocadiae bacterium]|nr:UPF0175 family protein [Candidatus Brocadiia bacterium]